MEFAILVRDEEGIPFWEMNGYKVANRGDLLLLEGFSYIQPVADSDGRPFGYDVDNNQF